MRATYSYRRLKAYWSGVLSTPPDASFHEIASRLQARFPKIQYDGNGTPIDKREAAFFLDWAMKRRELALEYRSREVETLWK